jgi:hypothetical protein
VEAPAAAKKLSRDLQQRVGTMSRREKLGLVIGIPVLVAIYFYFLHTGGWVFFPVLAAGIAVVVWPKAREAIGPLSELVWILLPLTLPLLVAAAVGTISLAWELQLILVPLALILIWFVIVRPQLRPTRDALSAAASWYQRRSELAHIVGGFLLLGLLIGGVVLVLAVSPKELNPLQGRAGGSTIFLAAAFILWMAAIVLRLLGYGTSLLRLLIALAAIALLARAAMGAGILPGYNDLAPHDYAKPTNLALAFGGLLALAVWARIAGMVLQGDVDEKRRLPARWGLPDGLGNGLAAAGFVLVVLAAAAIAVGAGAGARQAQHQNQDVPNGADPKDPPLGAQPRDIPPDSQGDLFLAQQYSPVLLMTKGEHWAPESVDPYLRRAARIRNSNGKTKEPPLDPENLPDHCQPVEAPPCFTLTIGKQDEDGNWEDCHPGSEDCATPGDYEPGRRYDGPAYFRVLRRGRKEADRAITGYPNAFDDVGRYFEPEQAKPTTLIQYWLFYPYDEWSRPILTGQLTQRHEADWEAVTVGLSGKGPIFVAYSAHCGSTWLKWKEIRVDRVDDTGLHPLVAVAEGSHANYPRADQRRAPDWAACAKGPAGVTTLLSYSANVRDETDEHGDGWSWYPSTLIPADARSEPMSFPGYWGLKDYTELENKRTQPIGPAGHGPRTPTLQSLWRDPLEKIFCSAHATPRTC